MASASKYSLHYNMGALGGWSGPQETAIPGFAFVSFQGFSFWVVVGFSVDIDSFDYQ
jgi:hypothetical protein